MITGKTKNLAVIGWPVAHSLSPVMHNAALKAARLDYVYTAIPIAPENLADAVKGFRAMNFTGFNVTIPHKQKIMACLDEIEPVAQAIGAVNTVINENGRLIGTNTDAAGFIKPLLENLGSIAGKNVVVLGYGGAARAVVYALLKEKIGSLAVVGRDENKAAKFADEFKNIFPACAAITAMNWSDGKFSNVLSAADIIVNTTPLGMAPHTDDAPPIDWAAVKKDAFVYDIIYTPKETKFLREAAHSGHKILNGELMLVNQAKAALERWVKSPVDESIMLETLLSQST